MPRALSMAGFGRAIEGFAKELEKRAERLAGDRVSDALLAEMRSGTPVDSGELKASWRKGAPTTNRRGVTAEVGATGDAIQAVILEGGRRRSKKTGRMLGSKKAKRGIIKPARRAVQAQLKSMAEGELGDLFR